MDTLRDLFTTLISEDKEVQIVRILQEMNRLLLTEYMLKFDENFCLYPIEVEAYYYNEKNFRDECVHGNDQQKNRFGQLYFHRRGESKDNKITPFPRGGIDICLSDKEDVSLGFLIRSVKINDEDKSVYGPALLKREILRHVYGKNDISETTETEIVKNKRIEERDDIVFLAENDKRKKDSKVINDIRILRDPEKYGRYGLYELRSLVELKDHPYKRKEKLLLLHRE